MRGRAVAIKTQQTEGIVGLFVYTQGSFGSSAVDFGVVVGECRIEMRREVRGWTGPSSNLCETEEGGSSHEK